MNLLKSVMNGMANYFVKFTTQSINLNIFIKYFINKFINNIK